jgi:Flp pilus assembly protein TadG
MLYTRRNRQRSRGQALAEFALIAPVMLLLLLLAVDFGRLFFSYIAVNNAAREATFYASARASDTSFDQTAFEAGVTQAALRETAAQGQGGEGAVTVTPPTCFAPGSGTVIACDTAAQFAGGIGNHVTVSVSQPFTFLTPIVGSCSVAR